MDSNKIPMVPNRKKSLPTIYGDTPSFLGCEVINHDSIKNGYDIVFAGVPYEGTITWGTFSGCELAPRYIRHAAARYGGYLPEYDINAFDYLKMGDMGDLSLNPNSPEESMNIVFQAANEIYKSGSIPFMFGGDHSYTPEIVKALGENSDGQIGIIHFDSHFDNNESFGDDKYPRCGPLYRISQLEKVRNESIVHVGIRGPRNSKSQMEFASAIGAKVYTTQEIKKQGIEKVIEEAIRIAKEKTKYLYVTICSDILDAAFNPGGPPDFNGLSSVELCDALYLLGKSGIDGLDYVEIYPIQDPKSFSSHLAAWAMIYTLVGISDKRKNGDKISG